MRGLLGVSQQPNRLDHGILRIGLPRVDHVIDRRHVAEVRMVGLALLGRNPDFMMIGIAIEAAIAEVAPQQTKLPQVIRDVLANIADRPIGAHDDLGILVRTG